MARPQQYDRNIVTDRAMHLFWHKGYYTTPVSEIIKTTGLQAGSLYSAFGSKEGLLLATLKHYTDQMEQMFTHLLNERESARDGFERLFDELIHLVTDESQNDGCLLFNTLIEVAGHQPHLCVQVTEQLKRLESCFRHGLERARAEGDLNSSMDINGLVIFVMGVTCSVSIMGRLAPDKEHMQSLVKPALQALFTP
ncbi:TetR/AcrR family transcriptional regulator [Endozoicomonas lisbonensis]|uniref:TetR/AcrR family transcriptional repressor of nem operon n=1 Tax=Endozoicomonas lisbonensis TaxID=3120522 RepID=A0ABV2SJT3_9GAMM